MPDIFFLYVACNALLAFIASTAIIALTRCRTQEDLDRLYALSIYPLLNSRERFALSFN